MDKLDRTLFAASENQECLQEIYVKELETKNKHDLIFSALKNTTVKDNPKLEKILLYAKIKDYVNFKNSRPDDGKLLGLDDFSWKDVELTYSEKKLLETSVENFVTEKYNLIKNFECQNTHQDLEDSRNKLIASEQKRRELAQELVEIKTKQQELMKKVAEYRVGNHQLNIVDMISDQAAIKEMGASSLKSIIINDLVSKEFAPKAIKEVEANIDKILNVEK